MLYIVSTLTCFNAPASTLGSLFCYSVKVMKTIRVTNSKNQKLKMLHEGKVIINELYHLGTTKYVKPSN